MNTREAKLPASRPPTITSIARQAGVSHATVSLVLNERGGDVRINAETAKRIRRIAEEANYVPNHLARGLRGKSTQTIGVLWSLCGPHHSEGVTRRLTLLAQQRGYSISIADSLSEAPVIQKALADFVRRGVDGVIIQFGGESLVNAEITRLLNRFKAVVVVARPALEVPWDQVTQDASHAIADAVKQLVDAGHRRLAMIGDTRSTRDRATNLHAAMRRCGLDPQTLQWIDIRFRVGLTQPAEVYQALASQCGANVGFDGLLCSCDELAAGSIAWLREQGRRVPQDVGVVGFNDSHFVSYFTPPIASVARSDDVVADRAIQLLFERLADPSRPVRQLVVPMHYIPRESAGMRALGATNGKD